MIHYYILHKPYGVLPQFTDTEKRPVLGDLFDFPKEVYPVGRLDKDSEGLLFLTNDKKLNYRLLHPKFGHEREYWVQVEGSPTKENLIALEKGITIQNEKTKPAKVSILGETVNFPERIPPIRSRKTVPTTWISLTLTEGKNRQVRKMTAAAGFPTLRLIRVRIENLKIDGLKSGEVREVTKEELTVLTKKLKLA